MMSYEHTIEYSDIESEKSDDSDFENSYVEDCGEEYGEDCGEEYDNIHYDKKIIQNEQYKIEDYLEANVEIVIPSIRKIRALPSDSDMYDEYKQFIKYDDATRIIQRCMRNFLHKKRIQDSYESNKLICNFKLKTISLWKHNKYNSNKGILKLDENIDDLFEYVLRQQALEEAQKSERAIEIARTNQLKWHLSRRKRHLRYNKNIQRTKLSKYLVKTVLNKYLECKDLSNIIILYCVSSYKCWSIIR